MELAIVAWIFCGIGAAFVAQSRAASGCLWFGLGVLLGPLGLALAFVSGTDRKCPHCRERIHPEATRCPRCQVSLAPSTAGPRGLAHNAATEGAATRDVAAGRTTNPPTKKCPDCAEAILAEARKCRFCGFVFPESPTVDQPAQTDVGPACAPTAPEQFPPPVPSRLKATSGAPSAVLKSSAFRTSKYGWLILAGFAIGIFFLVIIDNTSPRASAGKQTVIEKDREGKAASVGRTANTISVDTWGCATFDAMVLRAGSAMPSVAGCIDLDSGRRVIGPLEIKTYRYGVKFARIEVPGKGELWTFFSHLAK